MQTNRTHPLAAAARARRIEHAIARQKAAEVAERAQVMALIAGVRWDTQGRARNARTGRYTKLGA